MRKFKYINLALPIVLAGSFAYGISGDSWKDKLKEKSQQLRQGLEHKVESYQEKSRDRMEGLKQLYEEKRQNTYDAYQEYSQSELGSLVERNARELVENPARAYQMKRIAETKMLDYGVGKLKNMKVYDPADGRVKSFDELTKTALRDAGIRLPAEIEEDPTRAFMYAMTDSGYLINAKIININNEWISLNELAKRKDAPELAKNAYRDYIMNVQTSFRNGDYAAFDNNMRIFLDDVREINDKYQTPLGRVEGIALNVIDKAADVFASVDKSIFDICYKYTNGKGKNDAETATTIKNLIYIFSGLGALFSINSLTSLARRKNKR